ncbi:blue copper protein-like [Oryza brachyantha]|uniref:Phytocyanin domain-containing protein n=1 Tax=Oryza brachyantha TaxID=4533 RepID=J3N8H8_ORYBR|nr:blue copper protein-like [Oryza brachyantha]
MSYLVTMSMVVVLVLLAAVFSAAATVAAPSNATAATTSAGRNSTTAPPFGANHTVGEGAGWFFDGKANASAANYSAWAANRTFYLGDYLSFSTNTDNTVVHTTNATVYKLCGGGGDGGAAGCSGGWKPEEAFLAVMLTTEGANYFFSDAGGGEHCRRGMRFEVTVAHGQGLPPVPASYYEPLLSAAPAAGVLSAVVRLAVGVAFAVVVLVL